MPNGAAAHIFGEMGAPVHNILHAQQEMSCERMFAYLLLLAWFCGCTALLA